jgi:hypothetical protein
MLFKYPRKVPNPDPSVHVRLLDLQNNKLILLNAAIKHMKMRITAIGFPCGGRSRKVSKIKPMKQHQRSPPWKAGF